MRNANEFKIADVIIQDLFTSYNPATAIPEDRNLRYYESAGMFLIDLRRRALAIMALRGSTTTRVNLNAFQHCERMVLGGHTGSLNILESTIARHAVFIADESQYWD